VGRTGIEPVTSCLSSAGWRTEPTEFYFINDHSNSCETFCGAYWNRTSDLLPVIRRLAD
jgi:uncharacterized protein (DUF2461 family)